MRTAPIPELGTVAELPLALDAVEPDPFIADLPSRPVSPPAGCRRPGRRAAAVEGGVPSRAPRPARGRRSNGAPSS